MVKADAYGHGAVQVATAALRAGASWLAVALVREGVELRAAGIDAPVLLLSEPLPGSMPAVVANELTPSLYSTAGIDAASAAAMSAGTMLPVEICVDTGMRRVGCEPEDVDGIADRIGRTSSLRLAGIWSHCAVADELGNPFTATQFDRFDAVVTGLHSASLPEQPRAHIGNSAVAIARADRARDMVRCGIAMYGAVPSNELAGYCDLRPAMRLRSSVSFVKRIAAGDGVGYGHQWVAPRDRWLATVPIGYADGVRRDLGLRGGEVLIDGVRRPVVGVVTMDQLMVDVGDGDDHSDVAVGDEVVLLGRQGAEEITAGEVADCLGTIPYEVLCSVGPRVPRRYIGA